MTDRIIRTNDLKAGMVLALPMERTVLVTEVKVGRQFVNFWFKSDDGRIQTRRVLLDDEILIEEAECPNDHAKMAPSACSRCGFDPMAS